MNKRIPIQIPVHFTNKYFQQNMLSLVSFDGNLAVFLKELFELQ